MISESAFLESMRAIVLQHLPDEEDAFEEAGPRLARLAMSGANIPSLDRDDAAANHGGIGSIEALKFVLMMWGTWKMLSEWYKAGRNLVRDRSLEDEFREAWKRHLVTEAGFSVSLANEIVESRPELFRNTLPASTGHE